MADALPAGEAGRRSAVAFRGGALIARGRRGAGALALLALLALWQIASSRGWIYAVFSPRPV